jgi:hypothetical protein
MALFDRFRSRFGGLPQAPYTNGGGGPYPRLVEPPQPDAVPMPTYAALLRERDRLAKAEARAERRLYELRAELDTVSTTLLAEARGATERSVTLQVLGFLGTRLTDFAKSTSQERPFMLGLGRAFRADAMAKLQPSRPTPAAPPPQPAVEAVDPIALGEAITRAGRKASGDPTPRPFERGPVQPRAAAVSDEALAEAIVKQGRRVLNGD